MLARGFSVDIGNAITATVSLAGLIGAWWSKHEARQARKSANEANRKVNVMAEQLDDHYQRVERSYESAERVAETSREATLALLGFLQGQSQERRR